MRRHIQLKHSALVAALAAIYPLQAAANAGVTQFAIGEVTVQRTAASVPLASGSRVESGDLITTGSSGRTQLRFSDGGMVSLQPNSQFKIARYADSGDAKQDSFLVELARGGMRAVTGLIGKRNRENYKVTTSTATIGIRGSGFSMAYNPDGTLAVTTELDAIEVCNQAGCIGLNLGESALVLSANTLPVRTNQRASWNPPNPRRLITARNEDVNSQGTISNIRVQTGLAMTSAGLAVNGRDIRAYADGAAAGNPQQGGTILGYAANVSSGDVGRSGQITDVKSGSLADGSLMILGKWQDAEWSARDGETLTLSKSAFVMGVPTPSSGIDAAIGKEARYDLSSQTVLVRNPLLNGELLPSSHVAVDFGSAQRQLDVQLDVRLSRVNTQSPSTMSPAPQPVDYQFTGTANTQNAGFYGELSLYSGEGGEGTGYFKGFFGGAAAQTIGLSFEADTNNSEHGDLVGAGVFTRGALTNPPPPPAPPPPPNVALAAMGIGEDVTGVVRLNGNLSLSEGDIVGYTASTGESVQVASIQPVFTSGNPGDPEYLSVGQWAGLSWSVNSASFTEDTGVYVLGTPTPSADLPAVGMRAQYDLTNATPVYTTGSSGNGTLLSTSNLTIDFVAAGQFVDVKLDIQMPGVRPFVNDPCEDGCIEYENNVVFDNPSTNYKLRGSASGLSGAFSGKLSVETEACTGSDSCGTGIVTGFVAGASASKAGASFAGDTGSEIHGIIYGAGIFGLGEGSPAQTPVITLSSSNNASLVTTSIFEGEGNVYSGDTSYGASLDFKGSFLTGYQPAGYYSSYNVSYAHVANSAHHFGSIGAPSESDFIGWGYWAQAEKTTRSYDGYGYSNSTQMVNHLHYLAGKPTPNNQMPTHGRADYSLLGGTNPTATLNGQTQVGTLLPASNLDVNFGNSSVVANIFTRFGNTDATINTVGNYSYISGSRFESCGNGTTVNGFFTGAGAIRAGIVYQHNHQTLGTIQGAAGFQRTTGPVGFGRNE